MQTFKDKWDTTLCTDRVEAYAEIIIIEPCERRFTMYFSAQEARKIGRALIDLANEIEPPKPVIDVTKRDCTSYLGW